MGKEYLSIEGRRECYAPNQVDDTMTVGELISELRNYDEDMPVILNNDNGYTYGSITWSSFNIEEDEDDEDDDWVDDDEDEEDEDEGDWEE